MVINLGLVYKVQHHSGVIFQFVAFIRKRKRIVPDIVAAGGRYDHLVGFTATYPLSAFDLCLKKNVAIQHMQVCKPYFLLSQILLFCLYFINSI